MPRRRRCRFIQNQPMVNMFKPCGVPLRDIKTIRLSLEELEAIRLVDVEKMEHIDACKLMNISRPTFSRVLSSARRVVAEALVNGFALIIDGGDFVHINSKKNIKEVDMTKIIVSSMGVDLDAKVDGRFGRSNHFLLVNSETLEFEVIDNSRVNEMGSGAGIQTSEMVVKTGAKIVLTGAVGPKASAVLNVGGVKYFENYNGMSVRQAIEKFKAE